VSVFFLLAGAAVVTVVVVELPKSINGGVLLLAWRSWPEARAFAVFGASNFGSRCDDELEVSDGDLEFFSKNESK
jgi:hypothetical protein